MNTFGTTALLMLEKVSVLMAAALLLNWLLQKRSAALRHRLMSALVIAALVLPLMSVVVPVWRPLPTVGRPAPSVQTESVTSNDPFVRAAPASVSYASPISQRHVEPRFDATFWMTGAITTWALGALLSLLYIAIGLAKLIDVRRRSTPLCGEAMEIATGLGSRAEFLRNEVVSTPMTWGVVRPIVLLPAHADSWSTETVRASLLHELAHVKRLDWLMLTLGRVLCAIYWFHPLVWWVVSLMRKDSERACDDTVLASGVRPVDYAALLVEVVRSMSSYAPTAAIAMGQPSEVEQRVKDVLDSKRDRRTVRGLWLAFAGAVVLCVVLAMAALRPAAEASPRPSPTPTSTELPSYDMLRIIYIPSVQNAKHPDGYIRIDSHATTDGAQYTLTDLRTNTPLVDEPTTGNAFGAIAESIDTSSDPGPSELYQIPQAFAAYYTRDSEVVLSSRKLAKVKLLEAQSRAWNEVLDSGTELITGADVEPHASAKTGPDGQPVVALSFTKDAAERLSEFTSTHIGATIEIFMDGVLVSAPTIEAPLGRQGELTARWSMDQARDFAERLNLLPKVYAYKEKQMQVTTNLKIIGTAFLKSF